MNRRKFLKASIVGAVGTTAIAGKAVRQVNLTGDETVRIKNYRTLGRTGFKVSDLSFGGGILPNQAVIEAALDAGMNYIDTAEHYGRGRSETLIGKVMQNRERKKYFISTKINTNFGGEPTAVNIKKRYYKCLERLQMDYADCLMMHAVRDEEQLKLEGFHQAVKELKSEGRLRFCGVSNHGPKQSIYGGLKVPMDQVLMAAANDGRFDVVLGVYNFLQKEQGERFIEVCQKKNVGVTLMKTNPVKVYNRWISGVEQREKQGKKRSERVLKLDAEYQKYLMGTEHFKQKHGLKSDGDVRDAAIKFVLSHPGVHSVCLSMNNFDDLENFLRLSGKALEFGDRKIMSDYGTTLGRYYCRHACGICEEKCKHKVAVNSIMRYDHYFTAQHREKYAMEKYLKLKRHNAKMCEDCIGECELSCPYGVPVQSLLVNAHHKLTLA